QCISAFTASLGFAFVFRIHHHLRFAILGSFVGLIGWIIYLLTSFFNNDVIQTFFATVIIALFAELIARKEKAPATIFLLTGCFPLVPGRGIYESMLHCVQGNTDAFVNSLVHTFSISIAIALGIMIISTIFKIIKKYTLPKY
ncbi:MAG: threonine/serine exporter family protein, partial [Coprobacillaceae bacterium]